MRTAMTSLLLIMLTCIPAISAEISDKIPKMEFDTYIFSISEKQMITMRALMVADHEEKIEDLIPAFKKNGIVIFVAPEDKLFFALETGVASGILSTDRDFLRKFKGKCPEGIVIKVEAVDQATNKSPNSSLSSKSKDKWVLKFLSIKNTGRTRWDQNPTGYFEINSPSLSFWRLKAEIVPKKNSYLHSDNVKLIYITQDNEEVTELPTAVVDADSGDRAFLGDFSRTFTDKAPVKLDLLFTAPIKSSEIKSMKLKLKDINISLDFK